MEYIRYCLHEKIYDRGKMSKLSIVIPVYYNELNLEPLYDDIKQKFIDVIDFDYEIVMVDDGSKDGSWEKMKELALRDSHIKVYHLSRNFGSYSASLCGISHATGDCIVVKAADLQEPTSMILEMRNRWLEGNNVVLAVRAGRQEGLIQKFFANTYYWITQKFVLENMPRGGFDTFLIDRQVADTLIKLDEKDSALTGQILWCGYKTAIVSYIRQERKIGKSKWTFKKKVKLLMDTIYGFSSVPISLVTGLGCVSVVGAIIWALVVLVGRLSGNISVNGWTTLFIFNLFSFGIIMVTLGILGGYLWRTFNATRKRPTYIIEHLDKEDIHGEKNNAQ